MRVASFSDLQYRPAARFEDNRNMATTITQEYSVYAQEAAGGVSLIDCRLPLAPSQHSSYGCICGKTFYEIESLKFISIAIARLVRQEFGKSKIPKMNCYF